MGRKKLPTPEKYCEVCGRRLERRLLKSGYEEPLYWFNKRKYCSLKCCAVARSRRAMGKPPMSEKTGRQRARRMIPSTSCAICGKNGYTEVHHKDKNPLNNSPENLVRLCKSCHSKQHHTKNLCVVCGLPAKGHHLCAKHWQAWRKSNKRGWDTVYTMMIRKTLAEAITSSNLPAVSSAMR